MPAIRSLPPGVVNRIAAGEVVERPASAVKELIENAIDAGASRIAVELGAGGRALIAVTDDGIGMAPDELGLAIERHATSKLDDDDLIRITMLGFRGEALAALAAVSRLRIVSRPVGQTSAFALVAEAGRAMP
ncbi:MAG: DNA mismatch repair endonuclease MutL, partial [Geminicoccaceae bacterium]